MACVVTKGTYISSADLAQSSWLWFANTRIRSKSNGIKLVYLREHITGHLSIIQRNEVIIQKASDTGLIQKYVHT